ncbi:MAG TPA: GTPase HflX [Thermoanaerobaculia bacterium]|nr:GTPase HflX [Thermoanaerobaculia bacterium]
MVSLELARHLAAVSADLGRQVGVLITREGEIRNVVVGNAHQIEIPDVGRLRGGVGRFRGLRLVHTHLRGEPLTRDDLTDLALLRLDLVAAIQVDREGLPGALELAYLAPPSEDGDEDAAYEDHFHRESAPEVHRLDLDFEATMAALEEEWARLVDDAGETTRERALVIGITPDDEHFAETLELVRSAGAEIAGTMRQKRYNVHPKTVVGSGKLQEIVLEGMRRRAELAIFDIDLKPAQARAFEDATGMKAIDRTQLILDIFAQRARSRDGKLQVELAQLKYSLPRLTEKDEGLSRLTGGIGGRGPGETVMEIGRRRIRDRIRALEKQVEQLSRQRDVRRRRRRDADLPVLSIVGYTNAGKSTLLNALTNSEVEAEDKLFMTLDPTSRRLRFPREGEVIVTDTVGFLSDLPDDLVTAFRATLEELADADLLLHVVDATDPRLDEKFAAVEKLIDDLDLEEIDVLVVLNKTDLLSDEQAAALAKRFDGVAVSALARHGFDDLVAAAEERLGRKRPLLEDGDGDGMPDHVTEKLESLGVPTEFDPEDYGVVTPLPKTEDSQVK